MNAIFEQAFRAARENSFEEATFEKDGAEITISRQTVKDDGFFGVAFVAVAKRNGAVLAGTFEYTETRGAGIETAIDCFTEGDTGREFGASPALIAEIAKKNQKIKWHRVFDDFIKEGLTHLQK